MSDQQNIEAKAPPAWPIPTAMHDTLRRVIINCARPALRARTGRFRWSVVAQLTGHGSGYAAELCRWAGVDPNELVVRK